MAETVLEVKGIRKSFNGNTVLHCVDLTVEKGRLTALVGENGAGKSTLMKILMGEYIADSGEILLEGKSVHFVHPRQALDSGISMIFQELSPFRNLTVAQNIYIGREPHKLHFLKNKELNEKAGALLKSLDIQLDPERSVGSLTVSELQLLEIAKAVSFDSKVIIMDEPTSALTVSETRLLFRLIRQLKARGVGIIYISHKLEELREIADTVCVLRDGSIISTRPIEEASHDTIISEMVGRTIEQIYPTVEKEIGEPILQIEHLDSKDTFHDVSFEVRSGEILGFAGIVGAGRTEMVSALFGIDRYTGGRILFKGKEVRIRNPQDAIREHFALIPEDRAVCGLNLRDSILNNIAVTTLDRTGKLGGLVVNKKRQSEDADTMVDQLHIKLTSTRQLVSQLSGGNQQKVVIAKWLLTLPDIIFMDEPTRGIDVGAKYEIYQLIQELAKAGKAVIVISSEMPELLGICDRILVLQKGRIVDEMLAADATQEKIMQAIVDAQ